MNTLVAFVDKILASDRLKNGVSKFKYRLVNKLVKDGPIIFMNYGYAPEDGQGIPLEPRDEENRTYIQLYHAVAGAIDLTGLSVMEMSCGRGGGASYVTRQFKPRSYLGADRTEASVAFCKRHHHADGLSFSRADAQVMPFADESFDVVLNVEASHDYPLITKFFAEVRRVLKPGGRFLYADFRRQYERQRWNDQIAGCGLEIIERQDITANVVKGLEQNNEQTRALVKRSIPRPLRGVFRQFAGATGSNIHQTFATRKALYERFVMRKPAC